MEERIAYLMKDLDLGTSALSERTGIKPSSISHVLSGRNKPGFEFIQKVLQAIPELDARWFLTGEGEMYSSKQQKNGNNAAQNSENDLFSNVNSKNVPPSTPRESNIPIPNKQEDDKKGSEALNTGNDSAKQQTTKSHSGIERIVLFYVDGSFKEYQPGN